MIRLHATVLIFTMTAMPVLSHEKHAGHASQPIAATEERLALPNLPVTDRWDQRGGFREMVGGDESVILAFSYTECETLCGITNATLSIVDAELAAGDPGDVRIVTVAIDPIRDTPEAIRAEAEDLSASDRWLWLTGGIKSTRPLLEALRFPPGAVEDHDPIFLVGRPCRGLFTRIVGVPDPTRLIELARAQPACDD